MTKTQWHQITAFVLLALWLKNSTATDTHDVKPNVKQRIYAHYFFPFPISLDNKDSSEDYYANEYLKPTGEHKKHISYGGYLTDRPIPSNVLKNIERWEEENFKVEIRNAVELGIDGFAVDVLGDDEVFDKKFRALGSAVNSLGVKFDLMLMPDMEAKWSLDSNRMTSLICKYSKEKTIARLNGEIIVSPFNAESTPRKVDTQGHEIDEKWWSNVLSNVTKSCNERVAFIPLFQGFEKYLEKYIKFSVGVADWGIRDRESLKSFNASYERFQRKYPEKIFLYPIAPQDVRPKSQVYWESEGGRFIETAFKSLKESGGKTWIQMVTWNDYSETTQISPSCRNGYGYYALIKYFIQRDSTKEEILYFHRRHPGQQENDHKNKGNEWKLRGKTTKKDFIQGVFIANQPSVAYIIINGKQRKKNISKGLSFFEIPIDFGRPIFGISRQDKVVKEIYSNCEIKSNSEFQDYQYCSGSASNPVTTIPGCNLW